MIACPHALAIDCCEILAAAHLADSLLAPLAVRGVSVARRDPPVAWGVRGLLRCGGDTPLSLQRDHPAGSRDVHRGLLLDRIVAATIPPLPVF